MCLALLALDSAPGSRVVLAANRDERHDRPARGLQWWPERDGIAAGRDLLAGGTWLAVGRDGRFAAVLNDARVALPGGDPPSRGTLPFRFLEAHDPEAGAAAIQRDAATYAGFHFVGGDAAGRAWYCASGMPAPVALAPGIHGADNAGLDVDDPRLRRARAAFERALAGAVDPEALLAVLADDADPGPGDGDSRPVFIRGADFGSRCSTVLVLAEDGTALLHERRFDAAGRVAGDTALRWPLHAAAAG